MGTSNISPEDLSRLFGDVDPLKGVTVSAVAELLGISEATDTRGR